MVCLQITIKLSVIKIQALTLFSGIESLVTKDSLKALFQ